MERCFCIASHYHSHEAARRMSEKKSATKGNSKAAGCMAAHLLKTTSLHVLLRSFTINLSFLYTLLKFQKQPLEVLCEKFVLRNFAKFIGKHLCQRLFLIKLQANFIKKSLWRRCFPANFCEDSKNNFLIEHL